MPLTSPSVYLGADGAPYFGDIELAQAAEVVDNPLDNAGSLLVGLGSGTVDELTIGQPGQVLTVNGDGTAPAYATPVAAANLLYNGDMWIQQRATLGSTDDSHILDRWKLGLEAASAAVATQETSDVPTVGSKYALKLTVGSGEDNKFGIWQILPSIDCTHLRGQTVSLQAKLKATAAITDVRMAVLEWTGTADNGGTAFPDIINGGTASWGSAGTNPTLTTSWAYLNTPANLSPTTSWATYKVEGITVGASANNLAVLIWCEDEGTTVTTDYLLVTDVQLEERATCSLYARLPFHESERRCERFLKVFGWSSADEFIGAGMAFGTTNALIGVRYPRMHKVPTFSVSNVAHFKLLESDSTTTTCNALTGYSLGREGSQLSAGVGSAVLTAGHATQLLFTANTAGRLYFDAEL